MKRLIVGLLLSAIVIPAWGDLTWDLGNYGTIGLPFQSTEAIIAYDSIGKQALAGASLPVYTSPKNILTLEVGAVAGWQTNGAVVQPLIAVSHDLLPEISQMTGLPAFKSAHLGVFARYDATTGKAGVGPSFSYSFN